MKVLNVLPLIALLLVPATASAIVGTVDSLDHATDSNTNRFLRKEKESKGTKKKKKGKKATKTNQTPSDRLICKEIEALELDSKIYCADECSDVYMTCVDDIVVERTLPKGEKCYENGTVLTSDGNCVLTRGMDAVVTFDLLDACTNYPELEYCSMSVEAGDTSYTGTVLHDGTWMFKDQVTLTYVEVSGVDNMERGWRIYITIRFGHDQEPGRSRTIIATMDYGTTNITSWRVMDNVDGDKLIEYNCLDVKPEPITVLIEQFLKNPTLLVGNDKGEMDFETIEVNNMFTMEMVVKAEELGEDYMMAKQVEGDSPVTVLARRADMSDFEGSDSVASPESMYENLFSFPLEAFLDADHDFSNDVENGFDPELIEQTRVLVESIESGLGICIPDYEQVYRNITDVTTPIKNRGKLMITFIQTSDEPEDQTIGENRVLEFSNRKKPDVWEQQNFSALTEDFDWVSELEDEKLVAEFATDNVSPALLAELRIFLLGTGEGLPESEELLSDLVALDKLLIGIYDLSTGLEDGLVNIYDLILLVLKIEPILKKIEKTLKILDKVVKLVGIIKQTKPIVIPVRFAITKILSVLKNAIPKVKNISDKTAKPSKPKVRKLLIQNEKFRTTAAKTAFVNQNYLIVPVNVTRNCKSTNNGAKFINDAIDQVEVFFEPAFVSIDNFSRTLQDVRAGIASALKTLKDIFDNILSVAGVFDFIYDVLRPFDDALKITLSETITGPFCTKRVTTRVPYPCGVKYCRSCGWVCISYPCGANICYSDVTVTLPSYCKKTFSFTIGQIIDGVQGVLDFIFLPFNLVVDTIINAIPLPDIPIPGLSNLDLIKLDLPELPELYDLNVPAPFDKLVRRVDFTKKRKKKKKKPPIKKPTVKPTVKKPTIKPTVKKPTIKPTVKKPTIKPTIDSDSDFDFDFIINITMLAFPEFRPICDSSDSNDA